MQNCLRCNQNGCTKCTKFIVTDTRMCVEECPNGYTHQWSSTASELMGRICFPSDAITYNNSMQTVLFGVACGALFCFLIVLMGVIMFKRKQKKMNRKSLKDQLIDEEYDRHEFIRQLDELRPHAEYFLFMLNDTRKQIRKSYISGDTTASAKFYPIVRDLAKILILLNRPVELIEGPPHDWAALLLWADRILVQFKPQQQITQLIEFLQSPTQRNSSPLLCNDDDARLVSKHTTFKSLFYSTPVVQNRKKFNSATLPPSISLNSSTIISTNNNINQNKEDKSISSDDDDDESGCDERRDSKQHLSLPITSTVSDSDCEKTGEVTGSLISLQEFLVNTNNSARESPSKSLTLKPKTSSLSPSSSTTNPKAYGDTFEHVKNYLSSGSLFVVEDELIEFKLGLRPQDEITTEL